MTRELKFRAWDGGEIIFPDYIDRKWIARWIENWIPEFSKRVMQYTWLKDCKWVDIFEWDVIIELENLWNKCVVEWNEVACWFYPFAHFDNQVQWNKPQFYEVIWNIYESTELLK